MHELLQPKLLFVGTASIQPFVIPSAVFWREESAFSRFQATADFSLPSV
jgi:hypothetical protein